MKAQNKTPLKLAGMRGADTANRLHSGREQGQSTTTPTISSGYFQFWGRP